MSFLNQDVDENICNNCQYINNPYISSYGTYSPCINCVKGSNLEKTNKSLQPTGKPAAEL